MRSPFGDLRANGRGSTTSRAATKARLKHRQFARILRVLAEPRRVQILREVRACKVPVPYTTLLKSHPISAATLSHHVKELRTAGLIEILSEGRFSSLTLQREILCDYLDGLSRHLFARRGDAC